MKSCYWLLAAVLLAGSVHAVPQYGPMPGPAEGAGPAPGPVAGPGFGPGPQRFMRAPMAGRQMGGPARALQSGMDKLLDFLSAGEKPSAEALNGFLDAEIAPFFDFQYMAESAGGRLFEQLGADEQDAMVQDIKRSFLNKMAEKLGAYDNQRMRLLPSPRGDGHTAQVSVAVLNPGRYPARLDFRMYRNGERWLVYDVTANGQSAIVHYRNQLMRQVQERRMREMRQMAPPARPMGPMIGPGGMPPRAFGPGPVR